MNDMEYSSSHRAQTQRHVGPESVRQVIFEAIFIPLRVRIRKLELQRPEAGYQGYLMPKKVKHSVSAQFKFFFRFCSFHFPSHEAGQLR